MSVSAAVYGPRRGGRARTVAATGGGAARAGSSQRAAAEAKEPALLGVAAR
jgi:hypothetical protein